VTVSRAAAVAALAAVLLIAGCGPKRKARHAPARVPRPGHTETGIASWYGHPYHGRRAANGEVYDMEAMTAAHKTLPFETWVRVENLSNRKKVEVRVTDRGPFVAGRIIDLSRAAAREIDLIGPGTARVKLVVIAPPRRAPERTPAPAASGAPAPPVSAAPPAAPARFAVQVGAFRDRSSAERVRAEMESRHGAAQLVERPGEAPLWRVLVGPVESEAEAEELAARIRRDGNGLQAAFVVRL
jgi:rare lipoprotein A